MQSVRLSMLAGAVACLVATADTSAAIFRVGKTSEDPACHFDTIQQAVNAAASNGTGLDTIHVSYYKQYNEAVEIGTQDLEISGGYFNCHHSEQGWYEPSVEAHVSGEATPNKAVFRITGTGVKILRSLRIKRGANLTGGGIEYRGTGGLQLHDTLVATNAAQHGGGVYAKASGGPAYVEIGANTMVFNNRASGDGGGLYIDGDTYLVADGPSTIHGNEAAQRGGGLYIKGRAVAELSSPGVNAALPAFGRNKAREGGAIAAIGADDLDVHVLLFGSSPTQPIRIEGNEATLRGGAIYANASAGFILGSEARANIQAEGFVFHDNKAPDGAVIYTVGEDTIDGYSIGPNISFGVTPIDFPGCSPEIACNQFSGNHATSPDGAVFNLDHDTQSTFSVQSSTLNANTGDHLFRVHQESMLKLHNDVISSNSTNKELIVLYTDSAKLSLTGSTIAGNAILASHVIGASDDVDITLQRSIIDQPVHSILSHPGLPHSARIKTAGNIASRLTPLAALDSTSAQAPARFVDPAYNDFRLRPGSMAVDFAPAFPSGTVDILGAARNVELGLKPNTHGPADAGAYELQSMSNLVMNGGFNTDPRAWMLSGLAVLDQYDLEGTYQAPGKNSIRVMAEKGNYGADVPVFGLRQCIPLPNFGNYLLDGYALTASSISDLEDNPSIEWIFRSDSGDCAGEQSITRRGELFFKPGTSYAEWRTPTTPAFITVLENEFGPNASVEIRLNVRMNPAQDPSLHNVYALFDAISLRSTTQAAPVAVFGDGFE